MAVFRMPQESGLQLDNKHLEVKFIVCIVAALHVAQTTKVLKVKDPNMVEIGGGAYDASIGASSQRWQEMEMNQLETVFGNVRARDVVPRQVVHDKRGSSLRPSQQEIWLPQIRRHCWIQISRSICPSQRHLGYLILPVQGRRACRLLRADRPLRWVYIVPTQTTLKSLDTRSRVPRCLWNGWCPTLSR